MKYLSDYNTLRQLRALAARTRDDAAKLSQLVALSCLEPGTADTRGILLDLVHGHRESAEILERLERAVASQDSQAVQMILEEYSIRSI